MHATDVALGALVLARSFKAAAAQSNNSTSNNSVWSPEWAPFPDPDYLEYGFANDFTVPPNATGEWSIPSVDLSQPWSGIDSFGNDWDLYTAVFSSLLTSEGEDDTAAYPSGQWLRIPENSFEGDEIDDGWSVCAYPFWTFFWYRDNLEKAQDDEEGNCAAALPQKCIDQLLARSNAAERCEDWGNEGMPSIKACEGLTWSGLYDFNPLNGAPDNWLDITDRLRDRVSADNGTSLPTFRKMGPYARNGNETMMELVYDEALSHVTPYIVSYKYHDGETYETHSVLRCTRANQVAEGSRVPESVGRIPNGSSNLRIPGVATLALIPIVALLL